MQREIPGGDISTRHVGLKLRWEARDGRSGEAVLRSVVVTSVAKYLHFDDGQSVTCVLPRTTLLGRKKEWKSNPRFWRS